MKLYVVVETTGGWSGTETYTAAYVYFRTREAAEAYVARETIARRDVLWGGDIFEVHEPEDE